MPRRPSHRIRYHLSLSIAVLVAVVVCAYLLSRSEHPQRPPSDPPVEPVKPDGARPKDDPLKVTREDTLAPGIVLEGAIRGGETHRFKILLGTGRTADLALKQQGVDLVIEFPETSRRFDSPTGRDGTEQVPLLSDDGLPIVAEIRSLDRDAPPGRYNLSLSTERSATTLDRERVGLAQAYAHAYDLTQQRDPSASFSEILQAYEPLPERFARLEDRAGQISALISIGRAYRGLGSAEKANRVLQQALALARSLEDLEQESVVHSLLGLTALDQRDFKAASQAFHSSWQLSTRAERNDIAQNALHNLAVLRHRLGHSSDALAAFIELAVIARKTGDDKTLARALTEVGFLHLHFENAAQALEAFREISSLPLLPLQEGLVLMGRGRALRRLGQSEPAEASFREALDLWDQLERPRYRAMVFNDLAGLFRQQGHLAKAVESLNSALAGYQELGLSIDQARVLSNLGHLANAHEQPSEAAKYFARSLAILEGFSDVRSVRANIFYGKAEAHHQLGELTGALASSKRSVELVEQIQSAAHAVSLKTSFLAAKHEYFAQNIELLLQSYLENSEPGAAEDLLVALEKARVRALVDHLRSGGVDPSGFVASALQERLQERASRIARSESSFSQPSASGGLSRRALGEQLARERRSAERLSAAWRDFEALQGEIRRRSPRYATLTAPTPLTLSEVRQTLIDDDTTVLTFFLGKTRSVGMAISRRDLRVAALPSAEVLEPQVQSLKKLLELSAFPAYRLQASLEARRLADSLLSPFSDLLEVGRWVIVPSGELESLPFHVLPAPGSGDGATLVGERHSIVTTPSLTTLRHLRQRSVPIPDRSLIVADPVHRSDDPRLGDLGAGPKTGVPSIGDQFPQLEHSRAEAQAVFDLMPEGSAHLVTGFEADFERVVGLMPSRRILHFALHATYDDTDLAQSGLVLSTYDPSGDPIPGLLSVEDLFRAEIPSGLVVLSACKTALGKPRRGEGFLSLAQGFLFAGAGAVLVSLWDVDDSATRLLMERFYIHLFSNAQPTPDEALRLAQHDMRADPTYSAPYYWAGFLLQGDWLTPPRQTSIASR